MKSASRSSRSNKFPPGEYSIHTSRECDQLLKNRPIHLKRCTYDGKEVTRVPEKEGYRKLLVPSKEPTVQPKIITSSEFSSLVERSHIPTKEEKEAALAAAEREKERLLRESMARKEAIRQMDLRRSREKQGRMSDVEEESRQRTLHLLQRAKDLKLEQEEEVKRCNKLILETKCRAVRDAQVDSREEAPRAPVRRRGAAHKQARGGRAHPGIAPRGGEGTRARFPTAELRSSAEGADLGERRGTPAGVRAQARGEPAVEPQDPGAAGGRVGQDEGEGGGAREGQEGVHREQRATQALQADGEGGEQDHGHEDTRVPPGKGGASGQGCRGETPGESPQGAREGPPGRASSASSPAPGTDRRAECRANPGGGQSRVEAEGKGGGDKALGKPEETAQRQGPTDQQQDADAGHGDRAREEGVREDPRVAERGALQRGEGEGEKAQTGPPAQERNFEAGEREGERKDSLATENVRGGRRHQRRDRPAQATIAGGHGAQVPGDEGEQGAERVHKPSQTHDREYQIKICPYL